MNDEIVQPERFELSLQESSSSLQDTSSDDMKINQWLHMLKESHGSQSRLVSLDCRVVGTSPETVVQKLGRISSCFVQHRCVSVDMLGGLLPRATQLAEMRVC